jgi:hypothetical protein
MMKMKETIFFPNEPREGTDLRRLQREDSIGGNEIPEHFA